MVGLRRSLSIDVITNADQKHERGDRALYSISTSLRHFIRWVRVQRPERIEGNGFGGFIWVTERSIHVCVMQIKHGVWDTYTSQKGYSANSTCLRQTNLSGPAIAESPEKFFCRWHIKLAEHPNQQNDQLDLQSHQSYHNLLPSDRSRSRSHPLPLHLLMRILHLPPTPLLLGLLSHPSGDLVARREGCLDEEPTAGFSVLFIDGCDL